jgi:hypothetical protein
MHLTSTLVKCRVVRISKKAYPFSMAQHFDNQNTLDQSKRHRGPYIMIPVLHESKILIMSKKARRNLTGISEIKWQD